MISIRSSLVLILTFVFSRKNGENRIQSLKEKSQDACGNLKRSVSTISDKNLLLLLLLQQHDYNNNNDLYKCKQKKQRDFDFGCIEV